MKAKVLSAIIISIVISSCAIRKSEPLTGKVVDTKNDIHLRQGEVLYMTYCYKCHPMGEGGLGPALNSLNVPMFVKRFQVRHGLGVMPYFKKDQISKKDLHDITAYMSALKKL
ncbi:MAG TPA: cytochrome c [Flavipsychrobacter sp.]|nr:cytochrome c [Flavipsychrobacter sp.]